MQAARAALRLGDREAARDQLDQAIAKKEHSEEAWFLMYQVVDTEEERRICLENVLTLNPNHAAARAALDRLGGSPQPAGPPPSTDSLFAGEDPFAEPAPAETVVAPQPAVDLDEEPPFDDFFADAAPAPRKKSPSPARDKIKRQRRVLVAVMALLAIGTACMAVVAVLLITGVI